MSCAANYAWVNRSSMTFLVRQAFAKQFSTTPVALDMHVVYDVSHNIAKVRHTTLAMWQTRASDLLLGARACLPNRKCLSPLYVPVVGLQAFQRCSRSSVAQGSDL